MARVLVVDENTAARKNLLAQLAPGGYELLEASGVGEALGIVRNGGADVIVTGSEPLLASVGQLQRFSVRQRADHEAERTRVAHYLHDEIGQLLTALRMTYGSMASKLPPGFPLLNEKMQSCLKLTDEIVVAVQRLSTELRPGILDLGLGAAIDWHMRQFQSGSSIACSVEVFEDDEPLEPACATEIYRIYQEAIGNAARHSGAGQISVTLTRDDEGLILEVSDKGRGIAPAERDSRDAMGLLGMRERAALIGGSLDVEGGPGSGTTVRLFVPAASLVPKPQP